MGMSGVKTVEMRAEFAALIVIFTPTACRTATAELCRSLGRCNRIMEQPASDCRHHIALIGTIRRV